MVMSVRLLRLPIVLCALVALVAVLGLSSPPAEAGGPLVLAFYYAWYDLNTWNSAQLSDLPQQLYASADPTTIDRHVRQAHSAGIDGFVLSWYGPGGGNQTEANLKALLNTAASYGFRAAADFEVGSPYFATREDRVTALRHLLSVHASHPAYLRLDGRPVVFFWASQLLSVDEWAAIRGEVDPDHTSIWIVKGASIDYLSVFDGLHLYNIAWSEDPAGTLANWGSQVRATATTLGSYRYWAATAMPGWDDTRIAGRTGAFVRDRAGGDYYRRSWSGAVASGPDMVIITSFNEWMEGSMIEPSAGYGDLYLGLTGEVAAAYKSGVVPAAAAISNTTLASAESPAAEPQIESTSTPELATLTATPASDQRDPWPTPRPDGTIVHIVEEGDTLSGIASRYGVTVDDLLALNDLDRSTILRIGQNIIIAVLTPTPVPTPTLTPTPTRVPAIRSQPSPEPSRRPATPTPTGVPSATPTGVREAGSGVSPTPPEPTVVEDTVPDSQELLPWPAITVGVLLVAAIWLLFRRTGTD
jgi:LysM repeat protein